MRLALAGAILALILTQQMAAQEVTARPDAAAATSSSTAAASQGSPTSQASPSSPYSQGPSGAVEGQESLDRIRKALESHPLRGIQPPEADFHVEIRERQRLEDLLSTLDFKSGPVPPGGLYGYEQQRVMFNKVDRPLMQPYAAFSSGELITIALENLIAKYLGGRLVSTVTQAERSRAERAARAEVQRAIAEYCSAQPDSGAGIELCTSPPADR